MSEQPNINSDGTITIKTSSWNRVVRERDESKAELKIALEQLELCIELAKRNELERDEARKDAENSKSYKRVLKVTNAQLKRERDEARELAGAYKEYSQLLGDEINSMATVAHFHGWKSSRVEQGKVLREKIKQMEAAK